MENTNYHIVTLLAFSSLTVTLILHHELQIQFVYILPVGTILSILLFNLVFETIPNKFNRYIQTN